MSDRKQLISISYHSDDDTGTYEIGELDFGINGRTIKYVEKYGIEGIKELLENRLVPIIERFVKNCGSEAEAYQGEGEF